MLSKIKSPALAERHSPHGHHLRPHSKLHLATAAAAVAEPQDLSEINNHHNVDEQKSPKMTSDKSPAAEQPQEREDDDLESQHTATDLVIDHGGADEPSQCDLVVVEPAEEAAAAEPGPEPEPEPGREEQKESIIKEETKDAEQPAEEERREERQEENNNNNNNNDDNNNNNGDDGHSQQQQQQQQNSGKQTQLELLHIIETSRKRRLSKNSADSLSSFIRWSFSHFDATAIFGPLTQRKSPRHQQQQQPVNGVITRRHHHHQSGGSEQSDITKDEDEEDEDEDVDEEDEELTIANEELANDADHELQQSDVEEQAADLRRQTNGAGIPSSQHQQRRQPYQQQQQQQQHRSREMELARERLFRARVAKLATGGGSASSGPTAPVGQSARQHVASFQQQQQQQQQAATNLSMAMKRSRQAAAYSPEPQAKLFSPTKIAPANNSTTQLGFVVDRLNQQQQRQNIKSLDHIANQLGAAGAIKRQQQQFSARHLDSDLAEPDDELEPADQPAAASGISLQLQQFLQQQQLHHHHHHHNQYLQQSSPLDDLMLDADEMSPSSGGGGGARHSQSQQLTLAAAIHRALLSNNNNSSNLDAHHQPAQQSKSNVSPSTNASGNQGTQQQVSSSSFLVDSLSRQQQQQQQQQQSRPTRAYNTRGLAQAAANLASNRLQQQQMAISNRVALMQQHQQQQQQQRHAQAAAALSVLANGANPTALHQFAAAAAAAAAGGGGPAAGLGGANGPAAPNGYSHHNHPHSHQLGRHLSGGGQAPTSTTNQTAGGGITPTGPGLASPSAAAASLAALANQTEFKCDTCPSSFDDRHRLMQHQSIHLELKKDWFTETPVEEVMKIFNRRRGEFLCNLCNLRFEATLDYDQHNHQVHGPRPYCCQFCGNGTRTFKCWRQYLNHLYDHRYIFSCTIGDCDFTVNRRDSLRFHIFRFHLNCQLPQNQQVTPTNGFKSSSQSQLSPYNLSQNGGLGAGCFGSGDQDHMGAGVGVGGGGGNPLAYLQQHHLQKWSGMMGGGGGGGSFGDDEGDDTENEMNVAD